MRKSAFLIPMLLLIGGFQGAHAHNFKFTCAYHLKNVFRSLCRVKVLFSVLVLLSPGFINAQQMVFSWEEREDLNILLPPSVRIYQTDGTLADGEKISAVYAMVDLRDENLKLRALGSNTLRETTKETSTYHKGILSINGGYFSGNSSVSLLISDGEMISPGWAKDVKKGGFGMVNGKPEIFWTQSDSAGSPPLIYHSLTENNGKPLAANQAVGGGPVLLKNGEIRVSSKEEGFGGSHTLRHPRTAIGYNSDCRLIMMVVDGRQEASAGVTLAELANLMKSAGAIDAVNLDGGGSSAMVAREEIVNIPSDIPGGDRNSLRKNASALVLTERIPSPEKEVYYFDTNNRNYTAKGLWKTSNTANYYGKTPSRTARAMKTYNKAVYTFEGLPRKNYQLAAWWTVHKENSDSVAYVLHHGRRSDTILVNQRSFSDRAKWNILGRFNIGPMDSLEVVGTGNLGKINTDAIRLVAVENTPIIPLRGDLRIAVISDLNSGLGAIDYQWQVDSIIRRIPRLWKPDMVISGGDMVAGMGISDTSHLRKMWAGFDKHIAAPLRESEIPFAFTLGNHDGPRSYPVEQEIAAEYWKKPENDPGLEFIDREFFPNYYSFVKDDIFFVSWEASSSEITDINLEWMRHQFSAPEAQKARMKIVIGHMPLYSVAQERDSKGNVLEDPEKLQQLLEKYKVHTYISGHQHAYYPAKKGHLQLLNTGAAGSGPRGWLTKDIEPVNTITIMDLFYRQDSIAYHTYEIKEQSPGDMTLFDQKKLPSSMFGVNGFITRNDIPVATEASGIFSSINASENSEETGTGKVTAKIAGDKLHVFGTFSNLKGALIKQNPVALHSGRNTEKGETISALKINKSGSTFTATIPVSKDLRDLLSIAGLYVSIKTALGELRTQLTPENNTRPDKPEIISHNARNVYAVRDIEALYEIDWTTSRDDDGDLVSYTYQLASDPDFHQVVYQEKTGRTSHLKRTEKDWFNLLGPIPIGSPLTFYHRVLASDGRHISYSPENTFQLMKSNEPLEDFIEIPAPEYVYAGKIENADGGGYGAHWDHEGKLWLADYRGALLVKNPDGTDATFSPLKAVEIAGDHYSLNPLTGLSMDTDGNILVGRNRHLLKIDAATGKGLAAWEAPEGERAITSPRSTENGEVYAMSLFPDDPNYVLRQNEQNPVTFDLVRTVELNGRILARSFDMSSDGKVLYFPDPGSPLIQKYTSVDGITYAKEKNIGSTRSGSSAIQVVNGNRFYTAVRASGISPSSFHFRNDEEQKMWTLDLPEVREAEPRGIGVSPDEKTLIFCSWDQGGGYHKYILKQ